SRARSIAAMASLPQCSRVSGTGDGTSRTISLATDVGLLNHLAPLDVIVADQFRELRRRIGRKADTLRLKLRLDVGIAEHARHLGVHLLHDLGRHLRWHEDAEPSIDREARQRLADGRRDAAWLRGRYL